MTMDAAASRAPNRSHVWLAIFVFAASASVSCQISTPIFFGQPVWSGKTVMGYFYGRDGFDHTQVEYRFLTHIAHAFVWPDSTGNLVVPPNYLYPELNAAAHAHGVKMIVSLGGWGNCEGFPGMASDPVTRTRFIDHVIDFCTTHHYDGVDIDWEFVSNAEEQQNFVFLIRELSTALKGQDPPLQLSMAAPSDDFYGKWIDYELIHNEFDFIGFMTYDYHGQWSDHSGHLAPLYGCHGDGCGSVSATFYYALSRQIPPDKILLGVPFFGRSFDSKELFQTFTTSESYDYREVMKFKEAGWVHLQDECAKVPFLRHPDGGMIISFEDELSTAAKCGFVLEKQSAGIIIWELSGDRWRGRSELLEAIGRVFGSR